MSAGELTTEVIAGVVRLAGRPDHLVGHPGRLVGHCVDRFAGPVASCRDPVVAAGLGRGPGYPFDHRLVVFPCRIVGRRVGQIAVPAACPAAFGPTAIDPAVAAVPLLVSLTRRTAAFPVSQSPCQPRQRRQPACRGGRCRMLHPAQVPAFTTGAPIYTPMPPRDRRGVWRTRGYGVCGLTDASGPALPGSASRRTRWP